MSKKSNGLVSILMPAYNCEQYVEMAIESILHQTYKKWELLICDDCSTDNTRSILDSYSNLDNRIVISHNQSNQKLLQARNRLFGLCHGDYITFQDADDYSDPERVRLMVEEFERDPQLGLVASQVGYVSKEGQLLRNSNKPTTYEDTLSRIYKENCVGGSIMMLRKSALEAVGGKFREYFDGLSYQDYDLSFLIAQKFHAYSLSHVLYFYRQHENSASKTINPDRLITKDVVIHLAQQRRFRGSDDLMDGKSHLVDAYFNQLRQPYRIDTSLVYREYAANYMYNKLYRKAIQTAWTSVKLKPFKLVNWMTLQYCIRVTFLRWLGYAN